MRKSINEIINLNNISIYCIFFCISFRIKTKNSIKLKKIITITFV